MHIFNELTYIHKSSLALGYFDGLHLGHKVVLKNAVNAAKKNNAESAVILFKEHPLACLNGAAPPQLLTLEEKLEILAETGIDNAVILDFKDFASMRAEDYFKNVIIKYFSPIAVTTGFNHSFGFKRSGNSRFLREKCAEYGCKYYEIPPFTIDGNLISCSNIRKMIVMGDFYEADRLLGYSFFVRGIVVKGAGIASKLGFPSANINYPDDKVQLPEGVYFVQIKTGGSVYNGVLNRGISPDINNVPSMKTEVHIIGFNGDIYGKNIEISFITKIRNQIKFENTEKLKVQILRDTAFTYIYSKFMNRHFSLSDSRF